MTKHLSRHLSSYLLLILLVLLTACSSPFASASSGSQGNPHGTEAPITGNQTATPTSQPSSQGQTSCPATGTARAAVMPALKLGTRQEIIYYHNLPGQMMLDMFDVQRQAAVAIMGQDGEQIQSAQVSADGQWVLMVMAINASNISELQLVRVDGKFFQTLYCAPAGQQIDPGPNDTTGTQWSPDQKHILFNQGVSNSDRASLYILQLASGSVQLEMDASGTFLSPATWLDNVHVYIGVQQLSSLYLLDTSKGPGQLFSGMKLIRGVGDAGWAFDTSADGRTLYMSTLLPPQGSSTGQSEISADLTNGTVGKQILLSNDLSIVSLRVINSSSLMFVSSTQSGTQTQANDVGWWKINTDGTGLVQLNHSPNTGGAGPGNWGPFNPYTQYLWSNFSRDGSLYTDGLFFGSLKGGPLTRYASSDEGDVLVGWTTI